MKPTAYFVRHFEWFTDYEQAEQLQTLTWSAIETVPSNILIAMHRHGAVAVGAFDEAERDKMLGFAFSFVSPAHVRGTTNGYSHHSHMAAVLPEYRSLGIGLALKQFQAEAVRKDGYNLMTWTYDPLEAKNANFNLNKLGGICRTYIPNCYGEMRDELNAGSPSDRFELEWWLDRDLNITPEKLKMGIAIPADFQALKREDAQLAQRIRMDTRTQFIEAFARGLVAVRFSLDEAKGMGTYWLAEEGAVFIKNS